MFSQVLIKVVVAGALLPLALSGVTYTRWGRTVCGMGEDRVYQGIVAGPSSVAASSKSTGSEFLCMPDNPEYNNSDAGIQSRYGQLFAAEYDIPASSRIFETDNAEDDRINEPREFDGFSIPCAVCYKERATAQLMIPGRSRCVNELDQGWVPAFSGYLMAGSATAQRSYYSSYLTDPICVDRAPEIHFQGKRYDYYAAKISFIEAHCNDLPCPGYNNGKELTCVVCIN